VALQVKIEFGRVNHVTIHDGAGRAVPTPIRDVAHREETNVMSFSNDNDGDLGAYSGFLTRL